MRLLAFILIWVSLGVGAVAATTAYLWRVPATGEPEAFRLGEDEAGEPFYALLSAPAGKNPDGSPIALPDEPLTPEVVAALQEAGVERVKVKSFQLGRWTHLPHFIAACVGLLAGAGLTRLNAARAARMAESEDAAEGAMSPEAAVAELRAVVTELNEQIPTERDERVACSTITHRLGDAIRDHVPVVADQRDRLVARMGLGGYAALMDVFASAERAMNRAWSAAADMALDESLDSLEIAADRLAVVEDKLSGRAPSLLPLG